MKCSYCREENLIDAKFCAECGKPLSGDLPSYMFQEEPDLIEQVKDFFKEIKKSVNKKNYKEILADGNNPTTNMIIVFSAWLILRTIGIIPFIILLKILAFLMGYMGLFFLMVMTYVYSNHQKEIMEKVEELKGLDYRKTLRDMVSSFKVEDEDQFEEENSADEKPDEDADWPVSPSDRGRKDDRETNENPDEDNN